MKYYREEKKKLAYTYALELQKEFPVLQRYYTDEIENKIKKMGYRIYSIKKVHAPFYIRLTLPFAFIVFLCLFLFSPINYVISGKWGYNINWIREWFMMLD